MDKLTIDEVMHVAKLARINITDDELEMYRKDLKTLLTDVEKIKDIKLDDTNILVSPIEDEITLRSDLDTDSVSFDEIKKNVPKTVGNFVEAPVMVNE